MTDFDEARRVAASRFFSGGPVVFGGRELSKNETSAALSKMKNDALCVFDGDDDHRSGFVEVSGKRVRFKVRTDGSLLVTATDENETPEHVARLDGAARLIEQERARELEASTERHARRWKA